MPMRLGFGSCVQAMPSWFFFAMHKVCLTLQLLRSVPSTWFKPPCALESCFFLLSMLFSMPLLRSQEHIYILKYCIVYVSKLSTCSTRTTASLSLSGLASFCDGSHAAHERRFEVAFDPEWRSRRCSKSGFQKLPKTVMKSNILQTWSMTPLS